MKATKFWLCFVTVFAFATGLIVGMGSSDIQHAQEQFKYDAMLRAAYQRCFIHWHKSL